MLRAKHFLILSLFAAVAAIVVLAFLPSSEELEPGQTYAQAVSLYGYDDGGVLGWSVEASEAQAADDEGTLFDVEVAFHRDKEEKLRARADLLVFLGDETMLRGDVLAERQDGFSFRTQEVAWIETSGRLEAEEVLISSDRATVNAGSFTYYLQDDRSLLRDEVIAILDGSQRLKAVANEAEESGGKLFLRGEVSVDVGKESYNCSEIMYDLDTEEACLAGDVEGIIPSASIHARSLVLGSDGITASGSVNVSLDKGFFGGGNGA